MPRQKKKIEQTASPLPEKFEEFEKRLLAGREDHNAKVSEMLEQVKASNEPKPDVRPIGGMVEGKWSGVRMWTCPRCRGTTFDEPASRVHVCKQVRYASDEDVPDEE